MRKLCNKVSTNHQQKCNTLYSEYINHLNVQLTFSSDTYLQNLETVSNGISGEE